jgi:hypothetical protein
MLFDSRYYHQTCYINERYFEYLGSPLPQTKSNHTEYFSDFQSAAFESAE